MAEVSTVPMTFDQALKYLASLMDDSGRFGDGSKPVIGRLRKSYGYGKVIGRQSLDGRVVTRIDYDPGKGYHFNFVNYDTGEKICIPISNMTEEQYRRYIDRATFGSACMNIRNISLEVDFVEGLFKRYNYYDLFYPEDDIVRSFDVDYFDFEEDYFGLEEDSYDEPEEDETDDFDYFSEGHGMRR